jgi:hypothetical protein
MGPKVTNFWSSETRAWVRKIIRKRPEMADPDRPPGHWSLFDFGVRRVAEKRQARKVEVDLAEVERDVDAKRQARKQSEQDAAAAAAAAKRPEGRPKGAQPGTRTRAGARAGAGAAARCPAAHGVRGGGGGGGGPVTGRRVGGWGAGRRGPLDDDEKG